MAENRKKALERRMFASRSDIARLAEDDSDVDMSVSKTETVTPAEIAEFLHLSAIGHKKFYRYVKMPRLEDYLKSKKLYLSRLSEMNDLTEYNCTSDASRTYLVSFSFGSYENMAMWKLYGGEQDESVRLEFQGDLLVDSIGERDSHKVYRVDEDGKVSTEIPASAVAEWSFHDVAYIYGKALCWNHKIIGTGRCRALSAPHEVPELITRIKNFGWMAENEVRLVIRLEKKADVVGLKRIAVDFERPIARMNVLCGPVCSKVTRVKRMIEDKYGSLDGHLIDQSKNEVKF